MVENDRREVSFQLSGILEAMLAAYAKGDSEAIIFVHSGKTIALVNEWTEKWRKGKTNGLWFEDAGKL